MWRRFKRLKKPAKWVVVALVAAFLAAVGTAAGTDAYGLLHDPRSDYAIDVDANPDHIQTKTGELGGSYVSDEVPEAIGAAPNRADTCADRYEWAHRHGGIDAGSTTVMATVEGTNDHVVRIEGITPHILSKNPPRGGSFYTCGGRGESTIVRSVAIDLDQQSPSAVGYDSDGNRQTLSFQVHQSDTETFQVTAVTGTCDCQWNLVFHLIAEGHHYDETIQDGDHPFETTAPGNAVSYRWQDNRWTRSDSTAPGTPVTTIAPIPNACSLLTADEASTAAGTPVTQGAVGPATPTNGVTTTTMLNSICGWTAPPPSAPTSSTSTDVPSVTAILDGLDSAGAARAEYLAELAKFQAQSPAADVTIVGSDQAAELSGVVILLKGRLLLVVEADPAPPDPATLREVAAAAVPRLGG